MVFYKVQKKPTMMAGDIGEKELKLRVYALVAWFVTTIILVVLAIYAYSSGWSGGADQILILVSTIAGSGGIGMILGERDTGKKAGLIK